MAARRGTLLYRGAKFLHRHRLEIAAAAIRGIRSVCECTAGGRAVDEQVPLHGGGVPHRRELVPLPEVQIFGGGAHAASRIDIQDVMVMPIGPDPMTITERLAAEAVPRLAEI